jgi:D-glycero-D-manno-heptose 1,7-bisphosphate phosphatase
MTYGLDTVFLDRDGTVIEDAQYIKSPLQVKLLAGAAAAIKTLNDAGIRVVIATNQSGIARGLFTVEDYEKVRERFEALLAEGGAHIDASYFCPHHPDVTGECDCRKPGTKMFEDAMRDWKIDPTRAAYVGDRWRDVAASPKLGGRGILVPSPMTTAEDRRLAGDAGIERARSLGDAVSMLLRTY